MAPGACCSASTPRMPAAALEASAPGTLRSSTVTARPARASSQAEAQPITPPPTMRTSVAFFLGVTWRAYGPPEAGPRVGWGPAEFTSAGRGGACRPDEQSESGGRAATVDSGACPRSDRPRQPQDAYHIEDGE